MGRSLQKTYKHLPLKELKRRARQGDNYATVIYKVASYGIGVDVVLWLVTAGSGAGLFLILVNHLSGWLAVIFMAVIVLIIFGWLPTSRPNKLSRRSAAGLSKPFAKLLGWLVPITSRLEITLRRYRPVRIHTGLYDKEDLIELLHNQDSVLDNRISPQELGLAIGALSFGNRLINEIMTPRRVVKTVKASDAISPHLMDELHSSGFSRFPVLGDGTELVGTLYLKDLVNHRAGGTIADVIKPEVYYVHENGSLIHALNAFLKTKHHLFIVVNSFEEIVGVLSIEDILEQLLGSEIIDEFDNFENMRAVASLEAEAVRREKIGQSVDELH